MDHPFCFECGYDLSGLELPRPCPECGRLADPAAQAVEAREWFARRSTCLTWLVRPGTIPPGLWYVLSDPASVKLARRRAARWLWLPAILAVMTVSVGCFITVECDLKFWYSDRPDPDSGLVRHIDVSDTLRLFSSKVHSYDQTYWIPGAWGWDLIERQRKSLGVSLPEYVDFMFYFWGCVPLVAVAFGYVPSSKLVAAWTRHRARGQRHVQLATATRAAWSVMAMPLGLAAWVWLLAVVVYGVRDLCDLNDNILYLVQALLWVAPGWWLLVSVIGFGILARQDRPRSAVGSRLGLWAIAVSLNLGGPVVAGWGMLWLVV